MQCQKLEFIITFSFYFNSNIHEYNFGFVPTPLFFYGGEPQGEALRALWNELQFKMQSYITDLWRRLGVIYRQSNSSERVVDYFEATVDRFRGTGKPNFQKFRFELMLR